MDPFHIVIDPGSLELSHGAVTGKIHIANASRAFPEVEWNDFVVVILGWWLEAAAGILGGEKTEGLFQFMDGPFSVAVSSQPGSGLALTLQSGARRRVVETWSCDAETARRELVRSARSVLAVCEANGWRSDDITTLAKRLDLVTNPHPPVE